VTRGLPALIPLVFLLSACGGGEKARDSGQSQDPGERLLAKAKNEIASSPREKKAGDLCYLDGKNNFAFPGLECRQRPRSGVTTCGEGEFVPPLPPGIGCVDLSGEGLRAQRREEARKNQRRSRRLRQDGGPAKLKPGDPCVPGQRPPPGLECVGPNTPQPPLQPPGR
jgi:hypothetical protein